MIEENITGMPSIAIDSNDSVHIAYYSAKDSNGNTYSYSQYALKYATNENGSWVTSFIETQLKDYGVLAGNHPSKYIAIDSNDNVHIAFSKATNYHTYNPGYQMGDVLIANNTDGNWTTTTVYSNSTYSQSGQPYAPGRHVVLAIDSNDSLHLSWTVLFDDGINLHYSSNQSGSWSDTLIDRYEGSQTPVTTDRIADTMIFDSNDNVHLLHYRGPTSWTYTDQAHGKIIHYTQESGVWTNSTVHHSSCVTSQSRYDSCELEAVIDSNDVIHISYEISDHTIGGNLLKYSNNANGYFSPGIDVYPAQNVADMVVHSNGDVDFIFIQTDYPTGLNPDLLVLTSMNNSELNPTLPMYENNKIATGYNHSCGILHDNSLVCWGSDYYGQLGDGGTNTDRAYVAAYLPVDLGSGRTALAVAAGHSHTCAILDDGSLKCWGDNSHGQLGDGSTTDRTSPVQVDLGSGNTAVSISAGHSHTCAILDDGTLKCWGQDNNGQIGDGGTNSDQSSPVTINLGSSQTADSVSAGVYHTCAVLDDGSIKCWGLNNEGQLGDGSTTTRTTPVSVNLDAGKMAYAVAAGLHHTCAIVDDHLECWGSNDQYQLRQGSYANPDQGHQQNPIIVGRHTQDISKMRAISAGYNHTCLVSDNAMHCWGNLSDDTSTPSYQACPRYDCFYETPNLAPHEDMGLEIERHIAVSSYGNRQCAITSQGKVICMGYFAEDSNLETDIFMSGTYNNQHAYVISSTFSTNLHQWNNTAEAGSGTSPFIVRYEDVKYKFSGGGSTGTIASPKEHTTCVVHSTYVGDQQYPSYNHFYDNYGVFEQGSIDQWEHRDGTLVCRGIKYGQGDAHTRITSEFVSMDIPEERTVEYISPGNNCVILDDGSLMCWGSNYHGQVGDGSSYATTGPNYNKYSPVYVNLGAGRTAIAVDNGEQHTCAILDNGVVKCWGSNSNGQLGDGSTTSSPTPVSVSLPAGRNAVALASGDYHNCAILDNGSVMCWGYNSNGQLGDGNPGYNYELTPVYVDLGTNQKAVMIDAGPNSACVIFENGSLMCWGFYGAHATGLPVYFNPPAGYSAIDLAVTRPAYGTTISGVYVILDDNRVCRFGNSLGCAYVDFTRHAPSSVSPSIESADLTAVAISAGGNGFCAVLVTGALRCTNEQVYASYSYYPSHSYNSVGGSSIYTRASSAHSSGGMTGITGATCTVSPALPPGLSIDSSTCTISGTPTAVASNTTYTIVATLNNVNYQVTFWLSSSYYA